MRTPSVFTALACALLALSGPAVRAQIPAKYKPTIQKGLDWLARHQNPRTGHWEGTNGQYPVSMTGLAGKRTSWLPWPCSATRRVLPSSAGSALTNSPARLMGQRYARFHCDLA